MLKLESVVFTLRVTNLAIFLCSLWSFKLKSVQADLGCNYSIAYDQCQHGNNILDFSSLPYQIPNNLLYSPDHNSPVVYATEGAL